MDGARGMDMGYKVEAVMRRVPQLCLLCSGGSWLFDSQFLSETVADNMNKVIHIDQGRAGDGCAKSEAVTWIRPLGLMESFYAYSSQYVCANTVQAVRLSSITAIDVDLVARAVQHVASSVEILQICISKHRFGRLWLRKMANCKNTLEVSYEEPMKVFDYLLHTSFNLKEGPLWKCALSLNASDPNEAVLLLSIHHSITDGTTNLIVLREILLTLNALYRNDQVKLESRPVSSETSNHLIKRSHIPFIVKAGFTGILKAAHTLVGLGSYNPLRGTPGQSAGKVRVIVHEFSKEVTDKLLQRCKEAQVTVNCCVIAIARLAMFKLLQRYKPRCQKVRMNVENFVNLRRYLPESHAETMGCFISTEGQLFKVGEKDFADFWKLARKVKDKQDKHLNKKIPVRRLPLFQMLLLDIFVNSWLTRKGYRNVEICHIAVTNMGNVDKFLPRDIESHVKATSYIRSFSDHNGPSMCTLCCQTFRGKFMISIDHSTNKLTDEMIDIFSTTLVDYLQSIAHQGDISYGKSS